MIKKLIPATLCVFSLFLLSAEEIHFSADSMTGIAGSKTDATTLSGNAFVKTSSMEIKANSIELSGDDFRYIVAEGGIIGSITDSQMDFTCEKLKYDRKTKIAQLEESVHLVDNANDVTADAQLIEYNQESETAIMQIGVSLKQKDNVCTSAFAIYRKSAQMLEMSGNPKIIQGKDSFKAQEITLNLENQEITLDGRVSGTVSDSKKEPVKESEDTEDKTEDSDDKEKTEPPENDNVEHTKDKDLKSPASPDAEKKELKDE